TPIFFLLCAAVTSATAQEMPAHARHSHDAAAHAAPALGPDHMLDAHDYGKFALDKFEAGDDGRQRWDMQAQYGSALDKLWLKSEGERADGHTEHAELQALYSHAISPFFDVQVGWRQDLQPRPSRGWLALG